MKSIRDIAADYATLSKDQLFQRFYSALPVTSNAFHRFAEEIQDMAKHINEGIKL